MRYAITALIVTGAILSLALMFYVGQRQRSILLIVLFTGWVLAPFAALVLAQVTSERRRLRRARVRVLSIVITLASVAIYGVVAFGPHRAQPARFFLVVPATSLLLIAAFTPVLRVGSVDRSTTRG